MTNNPSLRGLLYTIIVSTLFFIGLATGAQASNTYTPPASLSTPLDDNYSNGCNDPGQYAVTDQTTGNTACYGSNGQPA